MDTNSLAIPPLAPLPPNSSNIQNDSDYIDLGELMHIFWQKRWWILFWVILTTSCAFIYAQTATPYYMASLLLQPVDQEDVNGMSGLSGSLGGLGSLVNLGGGNKKIEANLATLQSRAFITQFIEKNNILPILYPEIKNAKKSKLMPDMWDAYIDFGELLTIDEDKKTGLINVNLIWKDSQQAAYWANALVQSINNYLRKIAIDESQKSIDYLQKLAEETNEIEVREVAYKLLLTEIQKIKFAHVNSDYAFKVIDPAVKPKLKFKPKKKMIVVMGFFLGWLIALGVLICKSLFKPISLKYKPAN